jgi:hypothetical protein
VPQCRSGCGDVEKNSQPLPGLEPPIRLVAQRYTTEQLKFVKMCFSETCTEVHIGKNPYDAFPIQNGLKQGSALSP